MAYFAGKYQSIPPCPGISAQETKESKLTKTQLFQKSVYNDIHCNAVITRVTGAIKSNRVISDTAL